MRLYDFVLCFQTITYDNISNGISRAYMTYRALYGILPMGVVVRTDSHRVYVLEDGLSILRLRSCLNSTWSGVSVGFY